MKRKDPALDADPQTEPNAKRHHLEAEITRTEIEVNKAYTRLKEVIGRYNVQPDDQLKREKDALTVTFMEAWEEFYETQGRLRLACEEPGAGSSSGAGESSREAVGDVKMRADLEGMQSSECSDARTGIEGKGKDLVVGGGGDSGESGEQNLRLAREEPGADSSSGTGGSSREAVGDVKMRADLEGMQSSECSDARTGIEGQGEDSVVAGGGASGESDVSFVTEGGSPD